VRGFAQDLLDLLLPPVCAGCRRRTRPGAALCAACDAAVGRPAPGACARCQDAAARDPGPWCGRCAALPSPLRACVAATWFAGAGASWVKRFKYAAPGLAGLDPAAEAVAAAWIREAASRTPGPPPEGVVPVPLHPARIRERGFQPAPLLAREVARTLGIPALPRALARIRDTPSQTGRGRAARRRNVAGCFAAASGAALPARIWLVDDVVTTGATLGEAARALRRAGARDIAALCLARTPTPPR
jgi:ComF family protein